MRAKNMNDQFTYDIKQKLSAPEGGILASVKVAVQIEPRDAGCLIYGIQRDGNIGFVEIRGSNAAIDLPFAWPPIFVKYLLFVKYLRGLEKISITTLGWRDARADVVEWPLEEWTT
jgi:hypothetical protein